MTDLISLKMPLDELLAIQNLIDATVIASRHAKLEQARASIVSGIRQHDADKLAKVEFTAFWEANQRLQMGEAKALFAGKKLAFYKDDRTPLRRNDKVLLRTGFVLGGDHVMLTVAYQTDDGKIATQENGEPVLIWDADDLVDVKMVGRPDSHVDRHQTA